MGGGWASFGKRVPVSGFRFPEKQDEPYLMGGWRILLDDLLVFENGLSGAAAGAVFGGPVRVG